MLKAQNTHTFGVCRRVQVKLMEANVEGSRGQKTKIKWRKKKCLKQ